MLNNVLKHNIWNCLPGDTVDFSSLTAFKRTIKCVNLSDFLNFTAVLHTAIVSFTFVLRMFMFILFYFILFLGRLLVLYFSLVVHAICFVCALCVVCCMANDDDEDAIYWQLVAFSIVNWRCWWTWNNNTMKCQCNILAATIRSLWQPYLLKCDLIHWLRSLVYSVCHLLFTEFMPPKGSGGRNIAFLYLSYWFSIK